MATYEYEKVLADYANGRMDVEMTMGHALQHIGQLYTAQSSATADQHALRKAIQALEGDLKMLQASFERWQKAQLDRFQLVENNLFVLQQTITARQAAADSPSASKPNKLHPPTR
ncbi:MAG: hypothetical protein U0350_31785 [Caldilineaceae bacterium]